MKRESGSKMGKLECGWADPKAEVRCVWYIKRRSSVGVVAVGFFVVGVGEEGAVQDRVAENQTTEPAKGSMQLTVVFEAN